VRSAIQSRGDPEKEVHVLTADDLARAARVALDRVESVKDAAAADPDSRVDHFDLTLAGVEEGLKLAMRVLRQQSGLTPTSDPDRKAHDDSQELPCPVLGGSHSPNGR
jgi:hypothetical protein